ncbi:MAG: hypothetical protein RJB17_2190, partial [Pseudomonadota bacterium]
QGLGMRMLGPGLRQMQGITKAVLHFIQHFAALQDQQQPFGTACGQSPGIGFDQPRISASISSAATGTPRLISSQPLAVTMASSSIRMPMLWKASGTPAAGRT